ncbi:MAG TPA: glycoside hydrolase family 9 protein [Tepidisphaeraceae bacterium]|jgi:endoglucanase
MNAPSTLSTWCLFLAAAALATPAFGQATPATRPAVSEHVKACQIGYLPGESKRAMLTAAGGTEAFVRRVADHTIAARPTVGGAKPDADSGDAIAVIDFSDLREPGEYYLDVPGVGASHPFRVANDAFAGPFRLVMRSFLGQRCGTAVSLAPDFPQYTYEACHLGPATFHASSGKTGEHECTGGWHDAGDYGRYIVNSGITTGTLLWAYELNGAKLRKLNLNLPESGGAIPDVLAEIKWNIDWMLKMQDADGGVWHKATSERFCGFVMPKDDTLPVKIIGSGTAPFKTTGATADFAAVCAAAGRIYRPFDAAYADRCLEAAERAWQWLATTPDHHYRRNPQGIATGGYGDGNANDERLWAAAELFRTTGKPAYNEYFVANYTKFTPTLKSDDAPAWPNVGPMAMYTYSMADRADATAVSTIRRDALAAADGIVARMDKSGYRIPLTNTQYQWGSNGTVANYAMMLRLAHRIDPKPAYADAAQDTLHYLLGRNAFGTSFVTHAGHRWAMHPHHRPSGGDKIDQPWPGLLVGGPNSHQGRPPGATTRPATPPPPARVWYDHEGDYVTNENAINWSAPLVFILAEALPE